MIENAENAKSFGLTTRIKPQQLRQTTARYLLKRRVRIALHGSSASIISSNCLGGLFSQLAGERYLSPTVGLWFRPDDFISFATDLPRYIASELIHDGAESSHLGYPVGRLSDIQVFFVHYSSFNEARESWVSRCARIDFGKILLVFTDRDGATDYHFSRFDALPHAKLLFLSQPKPHLKIKSAVLVRDGNEPVQIGDLTTHWHHLSPALPKSVLRGIRLQLERKL